MGELVTRARQYTDVERINAAVLYAASGNYSQVARDTNIPRETIMSWAKDSPVWDASLTKARQEISDEILALNLANATKAGDELADRIEFGDQKLVKVKKAIKKSNGDMEVFEDYELRAEPMRGRDLVIVTGVSQDKARVAMNMPTSITGQSLDYQALAQQFKELSEQWDEKQVNVVKKIEKD